MAESALRFRTLKGVVCKLGIVAWKHCTIVSNPGKKKRVVFLKEFLARFSFACFEVSYKHNQLGGSE